MADTISWTQRACSSFTRDYSTQFMLTHRMAQQCQLVTPLQLYYSYKSAFENAQVRLADFTWHTACINITI